LSPRAAWRLESFGFTQVFDYWAGKVDWLASGLPIEGKDAHVLRAKDGMRRDFPTCRLSDQVRDVGHSLQAAGHDGCVVVNDAGVVLGYLGAESFDAAGERTADQVMQPGPSTVRPHVPLAEMANYMRERAIDTILVTTANGQWLGMLYRQDAERMQN
jgi:predicted transcriptional regulator